MPAGDGASVLHDRFATLPRANLLHKSFDRGLTASDARFRALAGNSAVDLGVLRGVSALEGRLRRTGNRSKARARERLPYRC